ncbi:hypothetical protein H4R33_004102 [Dimargaris cristalligena]|uniref:Uncharacterized protein n=1 Tax=Dimargaris cristalligena TaxID=215637 RepID=A0A4P9ZPP6_9FUNG|nr:hypothetical protein H4R33_004102 [Dimargaris cristalligena]RKP34320.1 hypothetical protein BJ085DRAFT_36397 [Dimargaris cristalligena]|eukprot:RKP34320.1 hypothetical protein BJ085DRAFT_36397 [Dimargaris cristalligena]
MNFWPQLVLTSFCIGYLTRHLDLITIAQEVAHEFASTSHKPLLLLCFAGLCVTFLLIVIPLERLAEFEHRTSCDYTNHSSAKEQLKRRGSF